MSAIEAKTRPANVIKFAQQAQKLSLLPYEEGDPSTHATIAVEAKFITPLDPVIETVSGGRLPAVPLHEADKLNRLKDGISGQGPERGSDEPEAQGQSKDIDRASQQDTIGRENNVAGSSEADENSLRDAAPPSRTHPLFPPLPLYGPPSLLRSLQCRAFRISSFFLSLAFLGVIVVGSAISSIPLMFRHIFRRLTFRDPDKLRPFYEEEKSRKASRRERAKQWKRQRRRRNSQTAHPDKEDMAARVDDFEPTEGGRDPIVCDVGYYARRVGLDIETFKVQTEDGFVIVLWHVYNPREYSPASLEQRRFGKPQVFPSYQTDDGESERPSGKEFKEGNRRYPVLLMHGLLQSAGAYCTNDDDSLAFFLCKSGFDVWLGNNRCGFSPEHTLLNYKDPRMWAWNIRQQGVMDLPALVSRVLAETGFEKLGLVCHSQGTTETFVALARDQRPDLGEKISVFCALAPAVYAGPLIGKMYFIFMRLISPGMFRVFFGIHAFIPFMMTMHRLLPGRLYGALGYRVFSYLFNWTDDRWERDLRDRMFQFAPVYVSAESMRWWLGRECFAKHKCILATREEGRQEDFEDEEDLEEKETEQMDKHDRGKSAWYNDQAPPFALWIAGSDDLVDGRRLLRRFQRGREPHVRLVHAKVIPEYEHLDVIWAMDSIEKVGKEVRHVLWKTAPADARSICRTPEDCQNVSLEELVTA